MKKENCKSLGAVIHAHTHNTFKERIKGKRGITLVALVITMVLHYDKVKKCSNSNSFLLSSI